jgi:hypothetical protein
LRGFATAALDPALAGPVARLIGQEEVATARVAKKLPTAVTRAVSADRVLEGH